MHRWLLPLVLVLSACADMETMTPGRGAEIEQGPVARVFPAGEEPREDRHGLWRGLNGEQVVWEVRYVRGLPAGPYREWNADGELVATWPYEWEGEISGWVRWYEQGAPSEKFELTEAMPQPPFDSIGRSQDLYHWWRSLPEPKIVDPEYIPIR